MNRLFAIIVVLFSFGMHQISWGMLTVARNRTQMHPLEKYWTPEKIEKETQIFLNSFGQQSLSKTGLDFCDLSMSSKEKVLSRLSHNQKLFVWFGAKGLDVCFLTTLCNGNEKVAHIYRNEPINKILENYARAKEWSWINDCDLQLQHCMALKNSQLRLLLDVNRERFIHSADIPKLMDALKILKNIELDSVDMKKAMDSVKIYPSLKERGNIFYNSIPQGIFLACSKILVCGNGITMVSGAYFDGFKYTLLTFFSPRCMSIWFSGDCIILGAVIAYETYPHYQHNLKNNVLPSQPTLTDYLQNNNKIL